LREVIADELTEGRYDSWSIFLERFESIPKRNSSLWNLIEESIHGCNSELVSGVGKTGDKPHDTLRDFLDSFVRQEIHVGFPFQAPVGMQSDAVALKAGKPLMQLHQAFQASVLLITTFF